MDGDYNPLVPELLRELYHPVHQMNMFPKIVLNNSYYGLFCL